MSLTILRLLYHHKSSVRHASSSVSYIQGQTPVDRPDVREYFYYIDSFGQTIHDLRTSHHVIKASHASTPSNRNTISRIDLDAKFLQFFFTRLRANTFHDRPYFSTFPYVSLCGRERNFIRCADVPFVLTRLFDNDDLFECCHIPSTMLSIRFEPERLYVKPDTGRVYYPLSDKFHTGIALIKDSIAERLSAHFQYGSKADVSPVSIEWKGKLYKLKKDTQIEKLVHEHSRFEI